MSWNPRILVPRRRIITLPRYQRGIIGAAGGGIMTAKGGGGGGWGPTIYGRVDASGYVVLATSSDFEISPTDAYAFAAQGIWLFRTSNNCYIRVGGDVAIGASGSSNWYNTSGGNMGATGTRVGTTVGVNVFELGGIPDSVNIYNKLDATIAGTVLAFQNVNGSASYTSDDKTTFFTPSIDTKYGRECQCQASVTGLGTDGPNTGEITVQFTFRKAGETDYTVTFRGRSDADATVEP